MAETSIDIPKVEQASKQLDQVAKSVTSAKSEATAIKGTLFGYWEGSAADAMKDTLSRFEECLDSLSESYSTQAAGLTEAGQVFSETDGNLAQSMQP